MSFTEAVELVAKGIDVAGVVVVVGGIVLATSLLVTARRDRSPDDAYRNYRRGLSRAILLGLEFLVAADIIRTVAVSPTFRGVGVLAIIVAIRTFLSMTLELEIEGRWPWEKRKVGASG
ncbi:MAG: DUF1622 domain-containing protein [Actinomycetota bacterium]|nr:DUF1622 domain-containing protein [Actinomycetota bacterium]